MLNQVSGSFVTECDCCNDIHKIYFVGHIRTLNTLTITCEKCSDKFITTSSNLKLDFNKLNIIHEQKGKLKLC